MRHVILLGVLALAACSSAPSHELPQTSDKDPTWQLNEGKWTFNENALITPPPKPADRRLPAAKAQDPGL
jgi:ABC-type transporter lipoprotein component MlaA